MAAEK